MRFLPNPIIDLPERSIVLNRNRAGLSSVLPRTVLRCSGEFFPKHISIRYGIEDEEQLEQMRIED